MILNKGNQGVSIMWMCRSGQTGRTQDPLAYAYAGSNPVIHINLKPKVYKTKLFWNINLRVNRVSGENFSSQK